MDDIHNTGILEKQIRVAEEILASTAFKDSLRLFLKNINPESGPVLVRTLMGRDVEVPLAVISAMPAVANCLIQIAMELVVQVRKYPAPMLAGMTESLLQDVDKETLALLIREVRELGKDMAPVFRAFSESLEEPSSKEKEIT
ncbi:MAG TPA: hypothetical protein PLG94_02085 [Smithellaceae bacterium]|jgi:hypothetical protein|nr:hypothetical protein [Smithella sp.]HPL65284.1 hypothetical protein [Smithellaceae bacterium]